MKTMINNFMIDTGLNESDLDMKINKKWKVRRFSLAWFVMMLGIASIGVLVVWLVTSAGSAIIR